MQQDNAPWQYHPDQTGASPAEVTVAGPTANTAATPAKTGSVSWTAPEYLAHERGAGWYLLLILGTSLLAASIYLLSKDLFAPIAIGAVGIIVGVFAARKPQDISYGLSSSGVAIGPKAHPYSSHRR
mgnify:CR=1 FL=1